MTAILTSDSILPSERVDWWRQRVAELFHAEYRIEPHEQDPFHVGVSLECAAPLVLLNMRGSPHHAFGQGDFGLENVLVHLQVEGHCTVRSEGRETLLGPGSLSLFRVGETTDLHFHSNYAHMLAMLPESALRDVFPDWSRYSAISIPTGSGTAAVLADHLQSLARHQGTLGSPGASALSSLTLGLVGATLYALDGTPPPVSTGLRVFHLKRVRCFALAHLSNPALEVDFIARGVGLSVRYIHRLFEDEPMPLMKWVMKERLERCRVELENADHAHRSICDVAHAWGFKDHAHFTRSFRKQFGVSPRDVRCTVLPRSTPAHLSSRSL